MIEVDDLIYAAFDNRCYKITEGGTATLLGTLPGTGPVYFARNQRTPTPQIYAVAEASEHLVTSTGITQVVLGTRGLSNSVAFLNGYFIVTRSDGTWGVSAINDVTFSDLDTAAAEGSPDKLVRVIAHKGDALLFGRKSLEVWQDVGASPGIPFQRVALKNIGLLSGPAVAGNEPGWADVLIFVASDGSVRRLDGYEPVRISTHEIDRDIAAVDPTTLEAAVYASRGHFFWALSSDEWTWVYDVTGQAWHERQTYQQARWRASRSVNAWGGWYAGDRVDGQIWHITDEAVTEGDDPLVWDVQSCPMENFPGGLRVGRTEFDMVVGRGVASGTDPIETSPVVMVSWSDDGGATFGNEVTRSLGGQGEHKTKVVLFRAGLTGSKGRIWRLRISDPVPAVLQAGDMSAEGLSP